MEDAKEEKAVGQFPLNSMKFTEFWTKSLDFPETTKTHLVIVGYLKGW